jgi:hypothetical protein
MLYNLAANLPQVHSGINWGISFLAGIILGMILMGFLVHSSKI